VKCFLKNRRLQVASLDHRKPAHNMVKHTNMPPKTLESLISKKEALEATFDGFEKWHIVFGILIAIGVVGESVYGFRSWRNNQWLHAIQQSIDEFRRAEITQLCTELKQADSKIAEAQRGTAGAKERTAIPENSTQQLKSLKRKPRRLANRPKLIG
jgi:hypothetical protein